MDHLSVEEEAAADERFQRAVAAGVKQAIQETGVDKGAKDTSQFIGFIIFAIMFVTGIYLLGGC